MNSICMCIYIYIYILYVCIIYRCQYLLKIQNTPDMSSYQLAMAMVIMVTKSDTVVV